MKLGKMETEKNSQILPMLLCKAIKTSEKEKQNA